MKIVHCECGLGNQMCYYAQYLALQKKYPQEKVCLETFLFDVPGIEKHMKMWNGYELEKVFGIKVNDVKDELEEEYSSVINKILVSKFWEIGWAASQNIISEILYNNNLIGLDNVRNVTCRRSKLKEFYVEHRNTAWGYLLRNIAWNISGKNNMNSYTAYEVFSNEKQEFFFDLFEIIRPNSGIQSIRKELLEAFSFPKLCGEKNISVASEIQNSNSVSIHVRKSDCYKYNADCFKFGYFKRSVGYIKQNVANAHFYIFSDDSEWVLHNLKTLGLDKKDEITFVNAQHYLNTLPVNVVYGRTIRDWIKNENQYKAAQKLKNRGKYERQALALIPNVIGRTDWDMACTMQLAPNAHYYHNNEVLRKSFYDGKWCYKNCEKHSIFFSQATTPIKGLHIMLRALPLIKNRYPDVKLYIAGINISAFPAYKISSYGKYLKDLIREQALSENVVFTGPLVEKEMKKRFLASNVFVSSSVIENSPNSVGEAMILGIPCITSDVGGVKNMIKHEEERHLEVLKKKHIHLLYSLQHCSFAQLLKCRLMHICIWH